MNLYINNTRKLFIVCLINFLFLFSTPINASECGIMKLQSNRSSGINIKGNECSKLPNISSGSIVDLSSKGRVWLKSDSTSDSSSAFQLICQNRSAGNIELDFSDTQSPWLNQSKLSNCSGWTKNKLTCDGSNGEQKGLYCVLSMAKASNNGAKKVERTTSVKMRSLSAFKPKSDTNEKQILAAINPELMLCKDLNQQTQQTNITWNVEQNAGNQNVNITSSTGLQDTSLSECFKTVITTFSYPQLSKKITLNSTL